MAQMCRSKLKVAKSLSVQELRLEMHSLRFHRRGEGGGGRCTLVAAAAKREKEIRRWKKQIFERKITGTAAQSRDVEETK